MIFNAKEMPEYPVKVTFAGMIWNVVLNYLLIPEFGIVGAATATMVSNAVVWSVLAYLSKIHFDVFFTPSHLLKPIAASLVMVAFLSMFSPRSILDGLLMVFTGAMVYFVVLYAIRGVRRGDVEFLLEILKNK